MSIFEAFNPSLNLEPGADISEKIKRNYRASFVLLGAAAIIMVGGKASIAMIDHELNKTPKIELTGHTARQKSEELRIAYEELP